MYPSVHWGMHLIGYMDQLNEASWHELNAFVSRTGYHIPPIESEIIIRLRGVKEAMYHEYSKDVPPPYSKQDKDLSESLVSSFFSRFKT